MQGLQVSTFLIILCSVGDQLSCKIEISNLKSLKNLEFELPESGVWVLTGLNGSGKSSLLTCILRIRNPMAFPKYFKASLSPKGRVDSFVGAKITYTINGSKVSYEYVNERWVPTPRKNAKLFEQAPFGSIAHIAADPDRIQPRQEDLKTKKIKTADPNLIKYANEIFDTTRFNNLRRVNATRGMSEALLIETTTAPTKKAYFSERNFSLGEICVLKLIRTVLKQPPKSLILIDEVELALHPRAQVKLLSVLKKIAAEKDLIILLSSHSVTLIKSADRKRLIFLDVVDGDVKACYSCFPSYILGQVAFTEESAKDVIFFVEDDHSDFLLEAIIDKFKASFSGQSSRVPQYSNIKIGGASQVVKFIEATPRMLNDSTRRFGVLDQDVEETLAQVQLENSSRSYLKNNKGQFKFLPVTPEVGLLHWLTDQKNALDQICTKLNVPRSQIPFDSARADSVLSTTGKDLRDNSKKMVQELLQALHMRSGKENSIICRDIYFLYVQSLKGDLSDRANTLAQSLFFDNQTIT